MKPFAIQTTGKLQTWTFKDRSEWNQGLWDNEPEDKMVWKDLDTGLVCMLHRNQSGVWCGYVGVESSHPFYGIDYSDYETLSDLSAHGGLTFSSGCSSMNEDGSGICHPTDGDDHVWWFGFDTNHLGDKAPHRTLGWGGDYRTTEYVVGEVLDLAKQLKEHTPD